MDGLSAAVNVIAVVQISEQVFNLSQTYYLDVRDARKDIQHLLNEVTSLRDVLINVKDLTDTPGLTKLSTLELLNKNDGLLQQCLADLTKLVKKLEQGQEEGKMKQFGIRALKWPFRKKEVDKAITVIERCKTMFALALNTDQTYAEISISYLTVYQKPVDMHRPFHVLSFLPHNMSGCSRPSQYLHTHSFPTVPEGALV
jgi:hypothetical protein